MKKMRIMVLILISLVCSGIVFLFIARLIAPQKNILGILIPAQADHPMYLSMVYTYINTSEQDYRKTRTTLFYIYDLKNKQLKKEYSIVVPSGYPVGIVDYRNKKVYYSIWGDLVNPNNKAGDKLQAYDLKTHKTHDVTGIHYAFNQMSLFQNKIYAIVGGLETNGNMQLATIDTLTGAVKPGNSNDTDTLCRFFSIDYNTGEILTLSYSNYSRRRMDTDQETGVTKPCPSFLSTTNFKLAPQSVIYTFSEYPYASLFGDNWGTDPERVKQAEKTANNLEVESACRLDNNTILLIGSTSVFSNDAKLKELHLDTKTVTDFVIKGAKYYSQPFIAPDKKGMYISLKMQDGTGGMYYYKFADKSLEYLFSNKDILKELPTSAEGTFQATDVELVVQ